MRSKRKSEGSGSRRCGNRERRAYRQEKRKLEQMYGEACRLRHDMKNHMLLVLAYMEAGETEAAREYIYGLQDDMLRAVAVFIKTDNFKIDAVINTKLTLCAQVGGHCSCQVLTSLAKVPEDVCMLLTWLLDNALEAALETKEKAIDLKISREDVFLAINLRNSVTGPVLAGNPELCTSKADAGAHGFGLKAVRRVAEKYQGCVEFYEEEGKFGVIVLVGVF